MHWISIKMDFNEKQRKMCVYNQSEKRFEIGAFAQEIWAKMR